MNSSEERPATATNLSPYAGWWVAFLGQRVIGTGATRDEAYLAAKGSRPKEEPTALFYVPPDNKREGNVSWLTLFQHDRLAGAVRSEILKAGISAYLVGGAVRDHLLGRECYDLDFVVPAGALALACHIADQLGAAYYPLDEKRGTARIVCRREGGQRVTIDIATMVGETIESDLKARDFTLNALAVRLSDLQLIDLCAGLDDLLARRLRLVSEHAIADDPVRALRAVRLCAEFGLHMDRSVELAILRDGEGLCRISAERIRDELFRILALPAAAALIGQLDRLELLQWIIPGLPALKGLQQPLPHRLDAWEHSLLAITRLEQLLENILGSNDHSASQQLLEAAGVPIELRPMLRKHLEQTLSDERPRWALLKLAALLHDVGKPACQTVDESGRLRFIEHDQVGSQMAADISERLRLAKVEIEYIRSVVMNHMRPMSLAQAGVVTERAGHRFYRDLGAAGVDVVLLALADASAFTPTPHRPPMWNKLKTVASFLLRYWLSESNPESQPPLVSGGDLIEAFDMEPGPAIGHWLRWVREMQVAGEIHTREEALHRVQQELQKAKPASERSGEQNAT